MNLTTESLNLTLSRRYPVSTAPDGNPIVHVGGDTVTVTAHDADLAWLNVRGDVEGCHCTGRYRSRCVPETA